MMRQGCKRGERRAPAGMDVGRYLVVAVMAVVVAACATLRPDSPEEEKVRVVTERSNARWQAIIGKDFAAAYAYMSPSSRAALPFGTYQAMASRLSYRGTKISGVSCQQQICRVNLILTYDAARQKGINTPFAEDWIIEKGQAWYVWPN
jgi:hypothetical protein